MHTFHSIENSSESSTGECPTGECPIEEKCPVSRGYIRATPGSGVLPYTTSDTITIDISGNVPTTQWNLVSTSWYFNNSYGSFPSGTSLNSLLKLPTGISQTLRINYPTPLHKGTYDVLLLLNTGSYSFFQQFGCSHDYWYFVYYSSRAGVNPLILDQISVTLQYYGKLLLRIGQLVHSYTMFYCSYPSIEPATVSIQSSRPALWDNEYTTLDCTADGGYPPTSSISWVKNGRVISTTNKNQLMITVAATDTGPFGQYVCLVNNSVTAIKTSFLMKQKGNLS